MLGGIGGRRRRGRQRMRWLDGIHWLDGREWVWVNSGSRWWTGRPGLLRFMGSRRVGHDWATGLNWTEWKLEKWRPDWNKKDVYWGFVRTEAQKASRSTWIAFLQTTKWERFIKVKTARLQLLHNLFIKNYNWSWQEVRVLVKQGLIGVWNGYIVTRGNSLAISLQLADVLKMVGVLG